jgi:hypothetical protein
MKCNADRDLIDSVNYMFLQNAVSSSGETHFYFNQIGELCLFTNFAIPILNCPC